MHKGGSLGGDDLLDGRIAVAERRDGDAGSEIEVSPVFNVIKGAASALGEDRWWADVGGYHVGKV